MSHGDHVLREHVATSHAGFHDEVETTEECQHLPQPKSDETQEPMSDRFGRMHRDGVETAGGEHLTDAALGESGSVREVGIPGSGSEGSLGVGDARHKSPARAQTYEDRVEGGKDVRLVEVLEHVDRDDGVEACGMPSQVREQVGLLDAVKSAAPCERNLLRADVYPYDVSVAGLAQKIDQLPRPTADIEDPHPGCGNVSADVASEGREGPAGRGTGVRSDVSLVEPPAVVAPALCRTGRARNLLVDVRAKICHRLCTRICSVRRYQGQVTRPITTSIVAMPGAPKLLLLSPSEGFGGGIERVAKAVEEAWPGAVERVDLYRRAKTNVAAGQPLVKLGFTLRALGAALRLRPRVVFSLHIGVLPVAAVLALFLRARLALMGLGREVWASLPAWERLLVRRCSTLLAISSFTAQHFARRVGVDPEEISIVRLPVGPLFRTALTSDETAPDGDSPLRLLSVSRIVPECRYKGLFSVAESLPEIVSRRPDVRWVVVGGGEDLPRLRDRCDELGVSAHVDFREDIDDAALLDAYREADLFVLPSVAEPDADPPTGEGFGIVYAEAACFGLPSIASAQGGGALDFIEDGVSGVTVPVDAPRALADAVERLGSTPEERHRLGEAAQARVSSHHLPEHFARVLRTALAS